MTFRQIGQAVLTCRVFDADAFKSDDSLGIAMLALSKLNFDNLVELELDLKGDGGGGTLHLALKLLPFDDSLLDDYDEDDADSVVAVEGVDDLVRESLNLEIAQQRSGLDLNDCPTAWKALAVVAGKRAEELYDPVCFIENLETNTQACPGA